MEKSSPHLQFLVHCSKWTIVFDVQPKERSRATMTGKAAKAEALPGFCRIEGGSSSGMPLMLLPLYLAKNWQWWPWGRNTVLILKMYIRFIKDIDPIVQLYNSRNCWSMQEMKRSWQIMNFPFMLFNGFLFW